MHPEQYLEDTVRQFHKLKDLADRALAQITGERFFVRLDGESNSVAIIMKHVAGNLRSRWTDFLTSDGEKADRNRDAEFLSEESDTKDSVRKHWEAGWQRLFETLALLGPEDLNKTVRIRGEAHTVLQAINRQLTHYAYHVGQIVFLAKHFAGDRWRSLSIPRGKSREFDVAKDGTPYLIDAPDSDPEKSRKR